MSFCCLDILSFIRFLSFELCKVFAFCSCCSDNKNPKGDTTAAPIVDTPASNEPPSQEAGAVVKSLEAPVKKGNSRASKRLKKAAVAGTSLDTHRPMVSTDDVSITSYDLLYLLLELPYSCLPFDRF
jgi:hypothetical protein